MQKKLEPCNMKRIIESINYPQIVIDFFVENKYELVQNWVDYPTICEIREKLNLSKEEYKTYVAVDVIDHLIRLLHKETTPGDCPHMRHIVSRFYNHGLKVEDVFTNCTALKNVIIDNIVKRDDKKLLEHLHDTILVFDYNLKNILAMYSDKISTNEKKLKERADIINENVLLTRTNLNGEIVEVTDAFIKLTGYSRDEFIGGTHGILRDKNVSDNLYKDLWSTIKVGKIWKGSISNIRKDGSKYITSIRIVPSLDEDGNIIEYLGFRYDITASELAKYDALTKLYNRSSFENAFELYSKEASAKKEPLSILVVDLDHFKKVNDMFGHIKGDEILVNFAKILVDNTRASDICSRWGGEEFTILLPNTHINIAYDIAERIRLSTQEELLINSNVTTCSIGVAQIEEGETYEGLFKRVDKYLYQAKHSGRNKTVRQEEQLNS